ncbi:MAG TPA: hypothetical protein VG603_02010 [Chitinophagales bacterium]|nr:hypothetical protein [Chitinophagales bacterium]
MLTIWVFPSRKLFRAAGYSILVSLLFLIILSNSKTKIIWYSIPVFPILSVLAGLLFHQVSQIAAKMIKTDQNIIIIAALFITSIQPVKEAYAHIKWENDDLNKDNFYAVSYYFREAAYGDKNLEDYIFLTGGYDIQWRLYVYRLNELGCNISCINYADKPVLTPGQKVVASLEANDYIKHNYSFRVIEDFYGVRNYVITGPKK